VDKVVKLLCGHCGEEYEAKLNELPVDENYAKDICPACGSDGWKQILEGL
jgi:DNA-directed RNA polymerase subunit RPC12/RpoP